MSCATARMNYKLWHKAVLITQTHTHKPVIPPLKGMEAGGREFKSTLYYKSQKLKQKDWKVS